MLFNNPTTDVWYNHMKARWLTAQVLRASSLAAKSIHPLQSSPSSSPTPFGPGNPFSTSTHHFGEAFPLGNAPDRLAQSNYSNLAQSNGSHQAPDRLSQSNGKVNDLPALARALLLSSINSHTITTTASSSSTRGI